MGTIACETVIYRMDGFLLVEMTARKRPYTWVSLEGFLFGKLSNSKNVKRLV